MSKFGFGLVLLALSCYSAKADSRGFGKCPHVEPKHEFYMHKMLGTWYVVQKTSTSVPCLKYNITIDEKHEGKYLLTETFPSSKLTHLVGLGHDHHVTGKLSVSDEAKPAVMDLDVSLDIGTYKFTVMMTDYDNFALVFSCKSYPLTFSSINKWSAAILSRSPTLDIAFVEKARSRLAAYNIDPMSMSIIKHHHCKKSSEIVDADGHSKKVEESHGSTKKTEQKTQIQESHGGTKTTEQQTHIEKSHGGTKKTEQKTQIHESHGGTKTTEQKTHVEETHGHKKTEQKVDESFGGYDSQFEFEQGGLNTLFENSDLDEQFAQSSQSYVPVKSHNQHKSSYLS